MIVSEPGSDLSRECYLGLDVSLQGFDVSSEVGPWLRTLRVFARVESIRTKVPFLVMVNFSHYG